MRKLMQSCSLAVAAVLFAGALACVPPPPPGAVVVERRPPPDRVEVIGVAPAPNYIWIAGHWGWSGGDYMWIGGRWSPIERGYRRWEPGHWRHHGHEWYWVEGHWR
ncbi:MAG TPA: hypothetical protein VJS20_00680 [Gemmatimonadales bacterium]|nr:hypothetical protein [Gemmatimonadales bacterium]